MYLEDFAEFSSSYFCGNFHLPRTASDDLSNTGQDHRSVRGEKPKKVKGLASSRLLPSFSDYGRRKLLLRSLPLNCVMCQTLRGEDFTHLL